LHVEHLMLNRYIYIYLYYLVKEGAGRVDGRIFRNSFVVHV
jgi:hypothetical protein